MFASNYDGSDEAYMDDFINKVGWGLNLAFAAGIGYPRTNWLIKDGSKEEQKFKATNRRHQVPTQVWYKAYPGLTTANVSVVESGATPSIERYPSYCPRT